MWRSRVADPLQARRHFFPERRGQRASTGRGPGRPLEAKLAKLRQGRIEQLAASSSALYPAIAWSGSVYMVAWHDDRDAGVYNIYFARTGGDGTLPGPDGTVPGEDRPCTHVLTVTADGCALPLDCAPTTPLCDASATILKSWPTARRP